jgi:hypothetical protein
MFEKQNQLLTRHSLATRWAVATRTVDRLRQTGRLPWIDIADGVGARPVVRFRMEDIQNYEEKTRKCIQKTA